MTTIDVSQVDERDSSWERPGHRYRVYVQDGARAGTAETTGGTTATYDVTGADLLQVVDWAQRQAGASATYAIALVVEDPRDGRGLVWLVGMDGNDWSDEPHEQLVRRRMLARRTAPVTVAAADRMPVDVEVRPWGA
ncbi:hypothetical protein BKA08_000493 [Nocardioides marinisabuli]|uniref:Uncharacterized protein n=1 Tax=Nocardioides marinisabuli TaxID=419476 RepID=A0A7Y9F034_9ACTN|nr:hypothetical protein [Nocardioides marinisabuli]NYD56255.1 hypothetical protein [Nocardioides marinisabuli]